jgi:hypothetical protein
MFNRSGVGSKLRADHPQRGVKIACRFTYEAVEGGAGALSRLIAEPQGFRVVAREALQIMHFKPDTIERAATEGIDVLEQHADARCVAGCYRCLLSYFNQPDHETIKRRHPEALNFLARLLRTTATDPEPQAGGPTPYDGCPPCDAEPLVVDGFVVPHIWRSARVAAVEEGEGLQQLAAKLAAKGVTLRILPTEPSARAAAIAELKTLFGRSA